MIIIMNNYINENKSGGVVSLEPVGQRGRHASQATY